MYTRNFRDPNPHGLNLSSFTAGSCCENVLEQPESSSSSDAYSVEKVTSNGAFCWNSTTTEFSRHL